MTTAAIAQILTENLGDLEMSRQEKRRIVHRHHETIWTDHILDEALTECRELTRQRDGLKEVLPANAELYDSQCTDAIRKVAEGIQREIELIP